MKDTVEIVAKTGGLKLKSEPEKWFNPVESLKDTVHRGDVIEFELTEKGRIGKFEIVEKGKVENRYSERDLYDREKQKQIIRMNCLNRTTDLVCSKKVEFNEQNLNNFSKAFEDHIITGEKVQLPIEEIKK